MIRMMVLLVSLLLTAPGECLFYKGPEKGSPEDLLKAGQAMTARCKGYGYKGIQASIVERQGRKVLQVTSDSGFTPEMKTTLNELAQLSGSTAELRFPLFLTDIEKEQYQAHANPAEDKAPPGAKWYRSHGPEEAPVLLRDGPVVSKAEITQKSIKEKSGSFRSIWEISHLETRELRELERKVKLGTPYLLMDGWVVAAVPLTNLEKNEEGQLIPAERMSFAPSSALLREALLNPMAFPLELESGPEGK